MKGSWDEFKTVGEEELEREGPRRTKLSGYLWIAFGMPLLGAAFAVFIAYLPFLRSGVGLMVYLAGGVRGVYRHMPIVAAVGALVGLLCVPVIVYGGMRDERKALRDYAAQQARKAQPPPEE